MVAGDAQLADVVTQLSTLNSQRRAKRASVSLFPNVQHVGTTCLEFDVRHTPPRDAKKRAVFCSGFWSQNRNRNGGRFSQVRVSNIFSPTFAITRVSLPWKSRSWALAALHPLQPGEMNRPRRQEAEPAMTQHNPPLEGSSVQPRPHREFHRPPTGSFSTTINFT